MVNRIFYNLVENYSCGHPWPRTLRKFLSFSPPPPLGIATDHRGLGGSMDIFWNHTF